MRADFTVLQVTPYLTRMAGGPYVSVMRLSQEVFRHGIRVVAAGVTPDPSAVDAVAWDTVPVRAYHGRGPGFFAYGSCFADDLRVFWQDIVHTHGLWLYPHLASYRYCSRWKVPLVVSPRGMLEPWAFRHNRWKKLPLWWGYEKRALCSARVIHATAEQEAEAIRALGIDNPIAVVPNGVDVPGEILRLPSEDGRRTALFLSRVHRKKGLLNLIAAWEEVRPKGWRMVVAGMDEGGHEAELKEAVRRAGLEREFVFPGAVFGEEKERLFRQAELFLLPTYSENFGIAIAEALAWRVPVVTTKGTPWREIEEFGCGWWIDLGVPPLVEALRAATSLPAPRLAEMGRRGRTLVIRRYSWQRAGEAMQEVYRWVLHGGTLPDCIQPAGRQHGR